jgi:hypothetical protein
MSRTATCTTLAIIELLLIDATQRKSEDRFPVGVGRGGDMPAARFDSGAGNRDANTHASRFVVAKG